VTIDRIKANREILTFSPAQTTDTSNVKGRLHVTEELLSQDMTR
jgi:hypothetical protein